MKEKNTTQVFSPPPKQCLPPEQGGVPVQAPTKKTIFNKYFKNILKNTPPAKRRPKQPACPPPHLAKEAVQPWGKRMRGSVAKTPGVKVIGLAPVAQH